MSSSEDHDCDSDERIDTSVDTSGHDSSLSNTKGRKRLKTSHKTHEDMERVKKRTSLVVYNGVNDLALEVLDSSQSIETKVESIKKHLNFMKDLSNSPGPSSRSRRIAA